jgi:hypothetical protein
MVHQVHDNNTMMHDEIYLKVKDDEAHLQEFPILLALIALLPIFYSSTLHRTHYYIDLKEKEDEEMGT